MMEWSYLVAVVYDWICYGWIYLIYKVQNSEGRTQGQIMNHESSSTHLGNVCKQVVKQVVMRTNKY